MASIKKILEKNQQAQQPQQYTQPTSSTSLPPAPSSPLPQVRATVTATQQQILFKELEQTCLEAYHLASQYNPYTFEPTCKYFPASYESMELAKFPVGVFFSAYPDASSIQTNKHADKVPKCLSCRAYMNVFNKISPEGTSFTCALCNKTNHLSPEYFKDGSPPELQGSCFTIFPPEQYILAQSSQAGDPPLDQCFTFLIDVSGSAAQSQMLYYAVNAIKQVLSAEKYDDHLIFLYTFDEGLHQYTLTGEEPIKTVLDRNVDNYRGDKNPPYLSVIRKNLLQVLDSLEEFSKSNTAVKSSFFSSFNLVFQACKDYSPKMFIFQANQLLASEDVAIEANAPPSSDPNAPKKSALEPINKNFFTKYTSQLLEKNISISLFCFLKNYKNFRLLGDSFKLTNSELFMYIKDSKQEQMKFYYDIFGQLSANYLRDFRFELGLTPGWVANGYYSNMYRSKDSPVCKINYLDERKRVALHLGLLPNYLIPTTLHIQIVASYCQQRVRKTSVTTYVMPVTKSLYHLYEGINWQCMLAICQKIYISSLRMEASPQVRTRIVRTCSIMHTCLKGFRKAVTNFTSDEIMFFQGMLSLLKSCHSHPDAFVNTIIMDRIIAQRNFLQSASAEELVSFFSPYLFKISGMSAEACTDSGSGFVYPESCQISFASVSNGIFVMDCSTQLFLYISKNHDPKELFSLFGIDKMSKETVLSEEMIRRDTQIGLKTQSLIANIRLRKFNQYSPLYIVRCGESSTTELRFYLMFANQKYEQFKNLNINYKEFMAQLESQSAIL